MVASRSAKSLSTKDSMPESSEVSAGTARPALNDDSADGECGGECGDAACGAIRGVTCAVDVGAAPAKGDPALVSARDWSDILNGSVTLWSPAEAPSVEMPGSGDAESKKARGS